MASARFLSLLRKKILHQTPPVNALPSMLRHYSKSVESSGGEFARGLMLVGAGVSGILSLAHVAYADEGDRLLACPRYPWPNKDVLSSYDIESNQRDKGIFRNDCTSCHVGLILHKTHVGVAYTERESGTMIDTEIEVTDNRSDEDSMFRYPRKFSNHFIQPCAIQQAATVTSGRACCLDLNHICKAVTKNQKDVFALPGGCIAPGVLISDHLRKKMYFPGGSITIPKIRNNGSWMLADGTISTRAQVGKDVASLLSSSA